MSAIIIGFVCLFIAFNVRRTHTILAAVRFQGLGAILDSLADHSPCFHASALNPAGCVKSRGLFRSGCHGIKRVLLIHGY